MDELVRQLKQIYVLLDDSERRALRSVAVTPTQVGLLAAVSRAPAGLTVSALAKELLCSRGNVTRLVQRLTESGLVTAAGDDHDQRLVLVHLTKRGHRLLAQAQRSLAAESARLQDHLTAAQVQRLVALTAKLALALEKHLAQDFAETTP
ncbi:MAG: MarR family transcriptional regulator [Nakamurella sp.]